MDLNNELELAMQTIKLTYEQLKEHEINSISIKVDTIEKQKDLKILNSKFGGYPYIPKRVGKLPRSNDENVLMLLAQFNLEELPKNMFPIEKGILQFFIDFEDDCFGMDIDDIGSGIGHKVIYYETIEEYLSKEELQELFSKEFLENDDFLEDDEYSQNKNINKDKEEDKQEVNNYNFPFEFSPFGVRVDVQDLPLVFTKNVDSLGFYNNIVENLFVKNWNKLCPENIITTDNYYSKLEEDVLNNMFDYSCNFGHKILGHAEFTQDDPRIYIEDGDKYKLLFQMDSDYHCDNYYEILWGDSGIANFFITEEDLKNKNFSNVLFSWDCG